MVSYAYDSNLTPSLPLSIHLINKEKLRKRNKNSAHESWTYGILQLVEHNLIYIYTLLAI